MMPREFFILLIGLHIRGALSFCHGSRPHVSQVKEHDSAWAALGVQSGCNETDSQGGEQAGEARCALHIAEQPAGHG